MTETAARRNARKRAPHRPVPLDAPAAALFEHLRALRLDLARREKIAAYMVFADRTLIEMARQRPASLAGLKAIHGVGETKLARYGEAFLREIATAPRSLAAEGDRRRR